MSNGADTFTISIRKRPWWFWTLAGAWLLLEVLFVQTAVASVAEGEHRAAVISWIVAAGLAVAAVMAWLHRGQPRGRDESSK